MTSEHIQKVKNLVKEGFNISYVKEVGDFPRDLQKLSEGVNELLLYEDFQLNEKSKKVSDYLVGFIVRKISYCECCRDDIIDAKNHESSSMEYIDHQSRGGPSKLFEKLSDYIAQNFSYLDATSPLIRQSNAPSKLAGEHVLKEFIRRPDIVCCSNEDKSFSALLARCPISSSIIKEKD